MRFEDRTFTDEHVPQDGNQFIRCRFIRCNMVYAGGEVPVLSHCELHSCEFDFIGEAANTLKHLSQMYRGGFQWRVEQAFQSIRTGWFPTTPAEPLDAQR